MIHPRVAAVAAGALAATGLVLVTPPGVTAGAAEATRNVTFQDCEVRELDPTNRRIADDITWNTQVRLNIPTPLRAGTEITAETELGALPANLIPRDLTDVYLDSSVAFAVDDRSDLWFVSYSAAYPDLDASEPLVLEELEVDTSWSQAGIYVHRPKTVEYQIKGYVGEDYYRYSFACDNQVNPPVLLTTAVYDPSATPWIQLDEYSVKQGGKVGIVGEHLLGSAPTTPAAEATVTVGGLAVGSYPIDESGAIDVRITVPPFTPPGAVQVRVTNGSRTATAPLQVVAGKGKVTAAPKKVEAGKKVTLTGSRFKPGEAVKLVLKGGRGAGSKSFAATVRTKANGTFTKAIKLKRSAQGAWRVTATGSTSKRVARSSFKVR
ncbi:MAG: hypothetical protein WBP61_18185 [Nocardioides sp.]